MSHVEKNYKYDVWCGPPPAPWDRQFNLGSLTRWLPNQFSLTQREAVQTQHSHQALFLQLRFGIADCNYSDALQHKHHLKTVTQGNIRHFFQGS